MLMKDAVNFRECREGYFRGFKGIKGKTQTGLKSNLKNNRKIVVKMKEPLST